jgi:hypothetical protein
MSRIQRGAWLFTRGSDSVRLVREENSKGCHLLLYGPGTDVVTHGFADVTECIKRQAEIEHNLLAEGYQFTHPTSDRRSERTERVPDHRWAAS